jgi:hypothetical protein
MTFSIRGINDWAFRMLASLYKSLSSLVSSAFLDTAGTDRSILSSAAYLAESLEVSIISSNIDIFFNTDVSSGKTESKFSSKV